MGTGVGLKDIVTGHHKLMTDVSLLIAVEWLLTDLTLSRRKQISFMRNSSTLLLLLAMRILCRKCSSLWSGKMNPPQIQTICSPRRMEDRDNLSRRKISLRC